jgi:hypothetical protein
MGRLFRQIERGRRMAIRWDIYQKSEEFKLIDAALLWLEIEPTPEIRESPPFAALKLIEQMATEINQIKYEFWISVAGDLAQKEGISEVRSTQNVMGISEVEAASAAQRRIDLAAVSYYAANVQPINYGNLLDQARMDLRKWVRGDMPLSGEQTVTKHDLEKLAKSREETPKFLFPEAIEQDNNEWNKGEVSKSSYKKLINALLAKENINSLNSEAAGQIEKIVDNYGNSINPDKPLIERRTIEKILNEINPERKRKTK